MTKCDQTRNSTSKYLTSSEPGILQTSLNLDTNSLIDITNNMINLNLDVNSLTDVTNNMEKLAHSHVGQCGTEHKVYLLTETSAHPSAKT